MTRDELLDEFAKVLGADYVNLEDLLDDMVEVAERHADDVAFECKDGFI